MGLTGWFYETSSTMVVQWDFNVISMGAYIVMVIPLFLGNETPFASYVAVH